VESLVLAAFAGGTAVLFAFLGVEALMSIAPQDFTAFASRPIEMDGRVLAFTGGLFVVVGLLFGVLPSVHAVTRKSATCYASSGGYASTSRSYHRFRGALVASQVGLSLAVLFGASLMGRSFYSLVRVDPACSGFGSGPGGTLGSGAGAQDGVAPWPEAGRMTRPGISCRTCEQRPNGVK
jgi:drug/metabolite transporter superfamily protein YnfA